MQSFPDKDKVLLPEIESNKELLEAPKATDLKIEDCDCEEYDVKTSTYLKSFNKVVQQGYQTSKKFPKNHDWNYDGKLRFNTVAKSKTIPKESYSEIFNREKLTYRAGNQVYGGLDVPPLDRLILQGNKDVQTLLFPTLRQGATTANGFNGWERVGGYGFKDYNYGKQNYEFS